MKSLIKILVIEIVLCIVYLAVASIVNGHYPFLERGYAPGMTCAYGVAALYFALLASMILAAHPSPLWRHLKL